MLAGPLLVRPTRSRLLSAGIDQADDPFHVAVDLVRSDLDGGRDRQRLVNVAAIVPDKIEHSSSPPFGALRAESN